MTDILTANLTPYGTEIKLSRIMPCHVMVESYRIAVADGIKYDMRWAVDYELTNPSIIPLFMIVYGTNFSQVLITDGVRFSKVRVHDNEIYKGGMPKLISVIGSPMSKSYCIKKEPITRLLTIFCSSNKK